MWKTMIVAYSSHCMGPMAVPPPPLTLWNLGILHHKQAKLRKYMQQSIAIPELPQSELSETQ